MRIFQNSVSFERPLAVSLPRKRTRFLGTRFLRSARSAAKRAQVYGSFSKSHPTFEKASDESGSSGKQF
jgi:hypothetical protein